MKKLIVAVARGYKPAIQCHSDGQLDIYRRCVACLCIRSPPPRVYTYTPHVVGQGPCAWVYCMRYITLINAFNSCVACTIGV